MTNSGQTRENFDFIKKEDSCRQKENLRVDAVES